MNPPEHSALPSVAIIGMAGRFPGAKSVAEFWRNQLAGVESISHFKVEELEIPNAADIAKQPNYVRARSILQDIDLFDAEFFGIYPREAELMDPQHRLFLECCWEALEDAGYDPFQFAGLIGVFAGCSMPTYFLDRLCQSDGFLQSFTGAYQVGNYVEMLGNSADFLATRVSYKLNLRGPSLTLQTACSTSLVSVCQACQSLLTYQADMALAGGVSITLPQKRGYLHQEGGMVSPDGHCRAFDANAQGTVFGSGAAVVLLKRLEDALLDRDPIYAVIRGFAVNNDGATKVGFTAPSVDGQAQVIATAQEVAGIPPETIGYIEAHGTGTPLGDPIELAALTQAFRARTNKRQFCAIGTVKTNVGHLDAAAGVAGLIHATHAVRHGVLPPTLHFERPNPRFELDKSPFYVNAKLSEWKSDQPRRAGVSSFGVGGTNAHVILEQASPMPSESSSRPAHLLVLSARSTSALDQLSSNLEQHLRANPDLNLADVAWTLGVGRRHFPHRRTLAARTVSDAVTSLSRTDRKQPQTRIVSSEGPAVHFLFPGQGAQHPNMAREIYETEPVFREAVDHCSELLRPHLNADLRDFLYPSKDDSREAQFRLNDTLIAQPAIFTVEYALAQLWMTWGIRPKAMLGHSIGEFVAACLAGVFLLEDALAVIAARGQMMQQLPAGGMLSVRLPASDVRKHLNGHLSLAAINAPSLCVVAGPLDALDAFAAQLESQGVPCRRLQTSHAFHSAMMDPIVDPFTSRLRQISLHPPQIPFVSGVTGTWITEYDATDPAYWARHLRAPVEFSAGLHELLLTDNSFLLEVGPGATLTTLARQHSGPHESLASDNMISSLGDPSSREGAAFHLRKAVGSLWLAGLNPNWEALYAGERRCRISLPTYPFERKRFWLERSSTKAAALPVAASEISPQARSNSICSEEPSHVLGNSQFESTTPSAKPDRSAVISAALIKIFEDLSGARISTTDFSTTFLEMGFDSLFLTQVTQALQSQFGLKITFRQLLSDQSTFAALSDHINANLPPDALAQDEPVVALADAPAPQAQVTRMAPPPLPVEGPTVLPPAIAAHPVADSAIERLMREQLQAMNELIANQLAALTTAKIGQPSAAEALPATPFFPRPVASTSQPITKDKRLSTPTVVPQKESKPFSPFKPPQKGASSNLTPPQQSYLQSFIDRYTKRTAQSKSRTQQHRGVLADPRVVSGFRSQWKEIVYPIITERSQGSRLWDIDGNEYVDLLSGFGPIIFGHRPDFVERAIERQLHEGFEIGPQTPLAGEVAQLFCEMTGNERMTFCNTGSEAVIAALRVARTVTARSKVVLFSGSYHGMFDEVLVKAPRASGESAAANASTKTSLPIAPGIPRESVSNVIVLEYGAPESLNWIRSHANELAAVLVEPVQSRHPDLQPREFLREVRDITEKSGTALIFDEVVTGFRVHPGGCQALFNIRADLATYGKTLAGGMPIGVLAGKAAFMDALDGGAWQFGDDSYPSVGVTFFAGTFVRHPLTLAAAKAVLQYFKEQGPQLQERLNTRAAALVRSLNDLLTESNLPIHIESFGSIFYFSFPNDISLGSLLYYHLRQKGIFLLEGFPCFLTTAHTDADIEKIIRAFRESIAEMQAADLLPGRPSAAVPSDTPRFIPEKFSTPTHPESEISVPTSTRSEAPLTESQVEIWLSAQLSDEASCAFNESFTLEMRGPLDESALRASLQELVNRHDALRASIVPERLSLHFAPHLNLSIPNEDLSSQPPTQRQILLDNAKHHEAVTPFDLIKGPLVRSSLFRLEPDHHALIITTHHLICDGWSTNVLLDELSKLYSAHCSGTKALLPQALQFSEFAHAQAQSAKTRETSDALAYWRRQFAQLPPVLELPTDRPRPAIKSFKGTTCRARIDAAALKQIKQAGARHGCTLFGTLFTGFALLLRRLTSQDDIVVGIPAAGQSLLDNANFLGHCVNFLPLRVQFTDNQPISQLLQSAKRTLLDAYEHQRCTYGTLVRELKLRRDPSRLPLVEVQFNLEKVGDGASFSGLQTAVDPNPKAAVNFDLFLNIVESREGLLVDCDYNSDLFDSETIARWLNHFETLLKGIANEPAQSADRLPILDDASLQQILVDWNATSADYPRDACVHELIELQAQTTPNAVAASFAGQTLTYAQLDRRANQLARHLIKVGVTPGASVAISLERSLEMLVSLLAIWKAGAAYIPLDPTYPRERLSYILEQTSTPILITQSNLVSRLPVFDTRLVCLDRDAVLVARELDTCPSLSYDSESNAYVIFTSGSTGKPKGVEVTHRNVVNLLCSMREQPGLTAQDRLLAVTTLSFDIAGLELFLPLMSGACVILASREHCVDGRRLLKLMNDSGVTVMQATPATWRLLLEAGWTGTPGLKILCGGEALPRDLANDLVSRGELWNMYGPTETTIWSATSRVEEGQGPVAIGPPIRNTQFYVLDKLSQPQPVGVPGELYIAGDGVARGYFQQPQMTAERFLPDPFANDPAARMYKTGDLVRYRPNGHLEFLGRLDNQVKIRGFRIELSEIEAVLARHPAVQECVVVSQEEEPGLKRLVAYFVAQDSQKPAPDELRKWIAGSLPDYMVPSIFVALPALPHTPNGKIDRKALTSLEASALPALHKPSVLAQTPLERQLAEICSEVLRLEQISVADSLFDLGADSLHLFQIAARATRAGLSLSPQQIMRLRTIAALAAEMDTLRTNRASKSPKMIAPVSREPYQLTSAPQAT